MRKLLLPVLLVAPVGACGLSGNGANSFASDAHSVPAATDPNADPQVLLSRYVEAERRLGLDPIPSSAMVASDGTPEVPGLELICGALGTWRESADGIVADAPDTARGVLAMVYTYCPSRFDEVVRVLRADSRLSSVPFDSYVATLKG